MSSEFNLYDISDDAPHQKLRNFVSGIGKKVTKRKRKNEESSSDESDSEKEAPFEYEINRLYEFDPDSRQLKHTIRIEDIDSWEEELTDNPYKLRIKFKQYQNIGNDQNEINLDKDP